MHSSICTQLEVAMYRGAQLSLNGPLLGGASAGPQGVPAPAMCRKQACKNCNMTSTCCSARRLSSSGPGCGAGSLLGGSLLGGGAALASAAAQIAAAGLAPPSSRGVCSALGDGVPGGSGSSVRPVALINPRSPSTAGLAVARSSNAEPLASSPFVASACSQPKAGDQLRCRHAASAVAMGVADAVVPH